jgi:RNA polymerase sigma factor (sigma-70 family)
VNDLEIPLTIKQHLMVSRTIDVVDEELERARYKYGTALDESDARSNANKALIACARRFEEGRGKSFATYARFRVRGVMLSHVRAAGRRDRILLQMRRALANRMAEYHDDFDSARHDKDECQRRLDAMGAEHAIAMALAGGEAARLAAAEDSEIADEYIDAIEAVEKVVGTLDKEERRLLDLIYASDFTFEEVAAELGVEKGTAWRRLRRLLPKLRRELHKRGVKKAPPPMDLPLARPVLLRVVRPERDTTDEVSHGNTGRKGDPEQR